MTSRIKATALNTSVCPSIQPRLRNSLPIKGGWIKKKLEEVFFFFFFYKTFIYLLILTVTFRVLHTGTIVRAVCVAVTGDHLPHLALHMAPADSFLWVHVSARL